MMARRTNTDAIRELEVAVARLNAQSEYLWHGHEHAATTAKDLAVLKQRVDELERSAQARQNYFWMLAGVVLGATLVFLGNSPCLRSNANRAATGASLFLAGGGFFRLELQRQPHRLLV